MKSQATWEIRAHERYQEGVRVGEVTCIMAYPSQIAQVRASRAREALDVLVIYSSLKLSGITRWVQGFLPLRLACIIAPVKLLERSFDKRDMRQIIPELWRGEIWVSPRVLPLSPSFLAMLRCVGACSVSQKRGHNFGHAIWESSCFS